MRSFPPPFFVSFFFKKKTIQVDFRGTENLATIATRAGVKKFVLVTSIGVDDPLFPLNVLWGVLFWKKQGELAVQRSGMEYTIIRPGWCSSVFGFYPKNPKP
jgi:uncharacterized protein YbjT (DUF2867 family)